MKKKATTYDILSWNEQSEENKCIWLFSNSKREMHWVEHGFIQYHPCAANALGWWGLRLEVGAQKKQADEDSFGMQCKSQSTRRGDPFF